MFAICKLVKLLYGFRVAEYQTRYNRTSVLVSISFGIKKKNKGNVWNVHPKKITDVIWWRNLSIHDVMNKQWHHYITLFLTMEHCEVISLCLTNQLCESIKCTCVNIGAHSAYSIAFYPSSLHSAIIRTYMTMDLTHCTLRSWNRIC